MKNKFSHILLALLFVFNFYKVDAQNSIKIKWSDKTIITTPENSKLIFPTFEDANHLMINNYLPSFHLFFNSNISNFKITNEIYSPLEEGFVIPTLNSNNISISHSTIKKTITSDVNILTIRINPSTGAYEKLISFDYEFTKEASTSNKQLRSKKTNAINSVLASGDWYKLGITNTGIHKIDYNYLVALGINPTSINPQNIQIYGNGGGMLPQANSRFRNEDLVQNSIYIKGENDQIFNTDDYILFYAEGPNTWSYDTINKTYNHSKNLYSDSTYYFLTINSGNISERIQTINETSGATQTFSTFEERVFHENDSYNILHSGREWYGEKFDINNLSNTLTFNIPNLTPDSSLKITSSVMGQSLGNPANSATKMNLDIILNNNNIYKHTINASGSSANTTLAIDSKATFEVDYSKFNSTSNLSFQYNFDRGAEPTASGYINFLKIIAIRDLKLYNNNVYFRNSKTTINDNSKFIIANPSTEMMIWDISNPLNCKLQSYTSEIDGTASFQFDSKEIKEFVAFSAPNFPSPVTGYKIRNQNLRANASTHLLIITIPEYLAQAERLATLRREHDNLSVSIVTVKDIYNEFSSGAQDITAIRDYIKHIYDKGFGTPDSLRYVLLFGSCSYDYKNRVKDNTNQIPVYESYHSLNPISSQSSDDYFGFLDINEGAWSEIPADQDKLDIGIGRIPARTLTEAEGIINKYINYAKLSTTSGKWRNKVTFIADGGDGNLHVSQADVLGKYVENNYKKMNVERLFLDAFQLVTFPDGVKSPDIVTAINNTVNTGALVINYTGHGGESQLSSKKIVTIPQILAWENLNNLPFFVTATCEVSRYDDPEKYSAGEYIIMSPTGGGIGLLTSARSVYSSSNSKLNTELNKVLFKKDSKGKYYKIGDIMMFTKNNSVVGFDNRNYAILGDPSMTLNYANQEIVMDSIVIAGKSKSITLNADTVKSLDKVTLKGSIRDFNNTINPNFTGTVSITYFDKMSKLTTLGQESGTNKWNYSSYNSLIYEGLASVNNGKFEFTFTVPKDISYQIDYGKISLYAVTNDKTMDAGGYNSDIYVGSSNKNAISDNNPPKIALFMNDESFVQGGTTNTSPTLLVNLSDENGINITGSGIGHEITGILDNNSANIIILNKYYTSKKDDYTEGKVQYKFSNLSPGLHTLKVKAWDSYNNSGEQTIEFVVANSEKISLNHVLNYPNPFNNNTTFHFDHNRAGDDLSVQIQVFTSTGKLIKTLDTDISNSNSHFSNLSWDGKDDFGDNIGKGVYVYKVKVASKIDGATVNKYEKLVILN